MSAEMSLVWLTMSKALEKSIAMVNVRCEVQGSLKPQAVLYARGRRMEKLEWLGRKPSCGWVKEEVKLVLGAEGVPEL